MPRARKTGIAAPAYAPMLSEAPAPAQGVARQACPPGDPGKDLRQATGAATTQLAAELMRATLSATPMHARVGANGRNPRTGAVLDLARAHQPMDGVQGAMASLAASLFFSASDLLRRAQAPSMPAEVAAQTYRTAARIADAFVAMTDAIQRRQDGGVR